VVGPDKTGEKDIVYLNFMQNQGRLFLVSVDPDTGETHQYISPQDSGGWATVLGPDKKIYIGTFGQGLILCFDPARPEDGIKVVGRPSKTETYIWQLVMGKDGKLYGCTYGNAKLVSYDPATGKMEDLGRMSDTEMYTRSIAAGTDGNVYVSVGTVRHDLVMYDPASRAHRSIVPKEWGQVGGVSVLQGADWEVYAQIDVPDAQTGRTRRKLFRVEGDKLTPAMAARLPEKRLRDGRVIGEVSVKSEGGYFTVTDPKTKQRKQVEFRYQSEGIGLFVVGVGPEGCIYGSTAMPLEVFRYDPRMNKSEHLGNMPGGEVYSMIENEGKLYLCYYGGSVMNLYDPKNPVWKFGTGPDCNPRSFGSLGDGHLRPRAMIYGPNGLIYIGSHPPYGQLGGAMAVWDPKQNKVVENYRNLVKNQSIVALAYEPKSGLIFGGSGNCGGGGTRPTEKEALFFAFDPRKKEKVLETALAPGAQYYQAICAAEGKVFVAVGSKLYVFDPEKNAQVHEATLPGSQVEISLGLHSDGLFYGLSSGGIYSVNPKTYEMKLVGKPSVSIGCGFALTDTGIYFGSGAHLWRWKRNVAPKATW
jgi:streptogramin lyase